MGKPYFIQVKAYICHRTPEMVLAGIWLVGLLAGGVSFSKAGIHYFLLMRSAVFCPVSIVGSFACSFLPFLLSAFAVFFNKPRLLYWICFLRRLYSQAVHTALWSLSVLHIGWFGSCFSFQTVVWYRCSAGSASGISTAICTPLKGTVSSVLG